MSLSPHYLSFYIQKNSEPDLNIEPKLWNFFLEENV